MHLKLQEAPKSWPIKRKGTTYVVKPKFNMSKGVPILILIRDVLKLASNRKEVKRIINEKKILLNEKPVRDEKNSALLFDTLTLVPAKKNYRVELSEKGKFKLEEIKETEAKEKFAKIIGKKTLKQKKIQLNLSDGRNFLSDIKCNTNDSVLINFKSKKIEKCVPLKEKAKIVVFEGKHIGKKGVISKINENKMAEVEVNGEKVNILIKQLMAVE